MLIICQNNVTVSPQNTLIAKRALKWENDSLFSAVTQRKLIKKAEIFRNCISLLMNTSAKNQENPRGSCI